MQPQISKVVFAQMAESVDALVSNTSGAIHPGSIPGLGTKMERSFTSLLFSFIYLSIYTHLSLHIYPLTSYHIPPFHENGEYWRPLKKQKVTAAQWKQITSRGGAFKRTDYWFPSEGALKADETTPCFRNIDIKNVTVNDKTYKKIDEKGITLDF